MVKKRKKYHFSKNKIFALLLDITITCVTVVGHKLISFFVLFLFLHVGFITKDDVN